MHARLFALLLLVAACSSTSDATPAPTPTAAVDSADPGAPAGAAAARTPRTDINPRLLRRFKPVRAELHADATAEPSQAQVDLGRMLFFDKRLSKDRDLSCNSCHDLARYGVDGEVTSVGAKGQRGNRNSPTVYHAAGHVRSFWDGRAESVEEQAKGPILNPAEMAMPDGKFVVEQLRRIPGYVAAFATAFPGDKDPLSYDNVGTAIGAFERGLVTPARWDRYLAGDKTVLTPEEIGGLALFTDLGCITCHTGEFVGGSTMQKAGVVQPWPNQKDQGRFEVTKQDSDRMIFKVPSLRNVAKTGPYFHDGSAKTLDEAVLVMARHQLGEELPPEDVAAIVTWLGSLTGELPASYIVEPTLPPDGPGM